MSSPQEEIIIKYLLNKLPEPEKEEFEEKFFMSDELFDQLKVAEMKLIDRFARREMNADEEVQFTTNFINTPERTAEVAKAVSFHKELNEYKTNVSKDSLVSTVAATKDLETRETNLSVSTTNNWLSNWRGLFDFKKPVFSAFSLGMAILVLMAGLIFITSRNSNENLVVEVTDNNVENTENRKINLPPTYGLPKNAAVETGLNQNIKAINQNKNANHNSVNSQTPVNEETFTDETILANLEPRETGEELTTANPKPKIEQEVKLRKNVRKVAFRLRLEQSVKDKNFSVTVLKKTGEAVESFQTVAPQKVKDKQSLLISVASEKLSQGSYFITAIGEQKEPIVYRFNIIRKN